MLTSVCLLVVGVSAFITRNKHVTLDLTWANLTAALQFETRSRGNIDARLTESRDARSEQLPVIPTEQLID